jgi:hypothetical protein
MAIYVRVLVASFLLFSPATVRALEARTKKPSSQAQERGSANNTEKTTERGTSNLQDGTSKKKKKPVKSGVQWEPAPAPLRW